MPDSQNEKIKQLCEEFKIGQGLPPGEQIERLKKLESFPNGEVISILNFFLTKETDPAVIIHLAKEVSKYGHKSSIGVLIDLLLWKEHVSCNLKDKEKYIKVRGYIAGILGSVKDNTAVLPLLYVLNSKDENYKVRLACAEALGRIGNDYAVAPLINVVSDENESSVYLRESAAKALGMLGDISAVDALVGILETKKGLIDRFTFLKERIIEALGRIGKKDDKTFRALKSALIDESPYIRLGAIEALAELEDEHVVPLIEPMLQDEEEDVARGAVSALYSILGEEYLQGLLERNDLRGWCLDEAQSILDEEEEEYEEDE